MPIRYHVALSFAQPQRDYARRLKDILSSKRIRVFYDEDERDVLLGGNLPEIFQRIYTQESHFVIMLISNEYVERNFPNLKRQYAIDRFLEQGEHILPIRFDDTEVPGLPNSIGYLCGDKVSINEIACSIEKKLLREGLFFGQVVENEHIKTESKKRKGGEPFSLTVRTVSNDCSQPVIECTAYIFRKNGTFEAGATDTNGKCFFNLSLKETFSVFLAHNNFPGSCFEITDKENLICTLSKKGNIGSIVINRTGYLPDETGIRGRLSPILDTSRRTYIYAQNISVNESQRQPVNFRFGENISLEEFNGGRADIQILAMIGGCALVNYITH